MNTRKGNVHLKIQTPRKNPVGIVPGTYQNKTTGEIKHIQYKRFVGYTLEQLKIRVVIERLKLIYLNEVEGSGVTF